MSHELFRTTDINSIDSKKPDNSINPDKRVDSISQKDTTSELSNNSYDLKETENSPKKGDARLNEIDKKEISDNTEKTASETIDKENTVRKIDTINQALEGKKHQETGVPFVRKIVDIAGEKIEGVFPVFDSKYDTYLPPDKYKASDSAQFKCCVEALQKAIEKDPNLAKQFDKVQLEQIRNGEPKIKGYTWHHNEELGKMQLVKSDIHAKVAHTGGASIWGGRNE